MYVHCEKLILVPDPKRREWWRGLLRPEQRLFDQAERCEAADNEEDAVAKALQAHHEGFQPIVVCPTADSRERLGSRFHAKRKSVRMLVSGYDDTNIGALLTSPSREVLLAWAGQRVLIEPTQAYRDALEQWVATHAGARKFLERMKKPELRLEDFDLVSRPDPDDTLPTREYLLEWRPNPDHQLALTLDIRKYEASLSYLVKEIPSEGSLKAGHREWAFGADGECKLDARDLEWIANTFDLDDDQLRQWSLPATIFTHLKTWLTERINSATDALADKNSDEKPVMLNPFQWRTVIDTIPLGQAAPTRASSLMPVRGAPKHSPVTTVDAKNLFMPLTQIVSGEPDLKIEVIWEPQYKRGTRLPIQKPNLVIQIDYAIEIDDRKNENDRILWENHFQTLVLARLSLPAAFRYGWDWDGNCNVLTIQIETLPETNLPSDAEGNG